MEPPPLRDQSKSPGMKELISKDEEDAGREDSEIGKEKEVGSADCVGSESNEGSAQRRTWKTHTMRDCRLKHDIMHTYHKTKTGTALHLWLYGAGT